MSSRDSNSIVSSLSGLLLLAGLAYAWVVIPYGFGGGDLLAVTGERARSEWLQNYNELKRVLTREIQLRDGMAVTAMYAADEYLRFVEGAAGRGEYPRDRLIFIIEEHAQQGDLPPSAPGVALEIEGRVYAPVAAEHMEVPGLQRKTTVQFEKFDAGGRSLVPAQAATLALNLSRSDSVAPGAAAAGWTWSLPLEFPPGLALDKITSGRMLFQLAGGLMSSTLMPCLLQLSLVFLAVLGGMSSANVTRAGAVTDAARRGILRSALVFTAVFIMLFAGAGAAIAYAGKQAQLVFADHYRFLGVAGGLVVILYGLWVGAQARIHRVVEPAGAGAAGLQRGRDAAGMLAVAAAFALGCFACYGGTLITALLVYAGTPGYHSVLVLGLFAAGVAVPFLLAASALVCLRQPLAAAARHARLIGSVSMTLIVCFGLLLATDSYHTVSDWMYPYLGLD